MLEVEELCGVKADKGERRTLERKVVESLILQGGKEGNPLKSKQSEK